MRNISLTHSLALFDPQKWFHMFIPKSLERDTTGAQDHTHSHHTHSAQGAAKHELNTLDVSRVLFSKSLRDKRCVSRTELVLPTLFKRLFVASPQTFFSTSYISYVGRIWRISPCTKLYVLNPENLHQDTLFSYPWEVPLQTLSCPFISHLYVMPTEDETI